MPEPAKKLSGQRAQETLFKSDSSEESQSSSVTVPDPPSKPLSTRSGRVVKKQHRLIGNICLYLHFCKTKTKILILYIRIATVSS